MPQHLLQHTAGCVDTELLVGQAIIPVRRNLSVRPHVRIMRCGSITLKRAVPIHDTDVSYAHEVEQCIPQIAYFETLVTNGKRTSENTQQAKFAGHLQSLVRRIGSALVSGWCQIGSCTPAVFEKSLQKRVCRSGTPYEQDLDHTPSLGPRQLYSLDTVFGQQGADAQLHRLGVLELTRP